jgi:hypothetical protein
MTSLSPLIGPRDADPYRSNLISDSPAIVSAGQRRVGMTHTMDKLGGDFIVLFGAKLRD